MAESARTADFDPAADLSGRRIGRFLVQNRLGEGGMGEVYRADDTLLRRTVALKRISPALRSGESYKRLLTEAERASRIVHPNVAAIHDLIEHGDSAFLVMEYVEGETLRVRIERGLGFAEALEVSCACASALAAAHAQGVIHCDIKPENIMLTPAGQVKVLDFGIARRVCSGNDTTQALTATEERFSGTPAYMAPEIVEAGTPGPPSDIFSLGVVLYEMLTGQNPFRAATLIATANRIVSFTPEPPSRVRPNVPERFDGVVMRMIEKRPEARQASATELLEDLRAIGAGAAPVVYKPRRRPRRWRGAAIAAGVIAIVLLVTPRTWRRANVAEATVRDVAVLPFVTSGESGSTQAFSHGLAETLSAKLSQLSDRYPIQIVPVSEVRKENVTTAEAAAQSLGAELVLEGTLRQAGDQVRITYAVVDTRSRRQVRADLVTASMSDPFLVEDRVVDSVLNALDIALRPTERAALAAGRPAQPTAYDYYLQGRGYLQEFHKPENLESAVSVFHRALEHDPDYAPAHAGLGTAYWYQYELNRDPLLVEKALQACKRAVAIDARFAGARVCLGTVFNGTGKYEEAAEEFKQALSVDPANDDAYAGLGASYESLKRMPDAEATLKRALRLRPNYWGGYHRLGVFYYRNLRYAEAAEAFTKVTQLSPDSFRAFSNLGGVYLATGEYEKAVAALRQSVAIRPTGPALSNLAAAQFYLRRFGEAAASNEQSLRVDEGDYLVWGNLGEALYWDDRRGEAANALARAIQLAEAALKVNARDAAVIADLAWFKAMMGETEPARVRLAQALKLAPADAEVLFKAALVQRYLGRDAEALPWLEKSLRAGFVARRVRDNPAFDGLRGNARFEALMKP